MLRFAKVGGGVTAYMHVRLQFRCLGNPRALSLKSHKKQVYLFRARSFIAKHGVLVVISTVPERACSSVTPPPSSAGNTNSIGHSC